MQTYYVKIMSLNTSRKQFESNKILTTELKGRGDEMMSAFKNS